MKRLLCLFALFLFVVVPLTTSLEGLPRVQASPDVTPLDVFGGDRRFETLDMATRESIKLAEQQKVELAERIRKQTQMDLEKSFNLAVEINHMSFDLSGAIESQYKLLLENKIDMAKAQSIREQVKKLQSNADELRKNIDK